MTPQQIKEKRIRLNHNCEICGGIIYIEDGTIIEGRPLHIKCYHDEVFLAGQSSSQKCQDCPDHNCIATTHLCASCLTVFEQEIEKAEQERVFGIIEKNREEIDYFLCYGLKQELSEEEIQSFKKIFIALYEDKLKSLIQNNSPNTNPQRIIGLNEKQSVSEHSDSEDKTADKEPSENGARIKEGSAICSNCGEPVFGLDQHLDTEGYYFCKYKEITPSPSNVKMEGEE